MSEKPDEVEIKDEDLELAAGGIILATNPSQSKSNSPYSYNQTIYFQADINNS